MEMNQRRRKSNRLEGYDYSQAGFYYVTVCVWDRQCLFGEIVEGRMVLNEAGRMVKRTWNELPEFYRGVLTDQFQIMPNHVHGIVVITGDETRQGNVGTGPCACPDIVHPGRGQPQGVVPTLSLSDIVHRFKSMTTHRYMANVKDGEWKPFDGKLWQRSFYDHVIRDDEDMNRIREYIQNNPLKWAIDEFNPANQAGRRDRPLRLS